MANEKNSSISDEIDLVDILKMIWFSRKTIFRITALWVLLGIGYAMIAPQEYIVSTTMIPQTKEGNKGLGGSLGGLASLAGVNIGRDFSGEIPPTLYPKIVNSLPFQREMFNTMITTSRADIKVSFEEYESDYGETGVLSIIRKYTIGLPGTVLKAFQGDPDPNVISSSLVPDDLIRISYSEKRLVESLAGKLDLSVDDKDGIITLSAIMPEPIAAAQMAMNAQRLLQEAITAFKVQKARQQLVFKEKLYKERKDEFLIKQRTLAEFRDRNLNISTSLARNEEERLGAEYGLALNVYNEIAKQLENARIQLEEDTPSFTILQPVIVPIERFKPKRKRIVLSALFMGFILSLGYIYGRYKYSELKNEW